MIFELNGTPEEMAKILEAKLNWMGDISPVTEKGFTIERRGHNPKFDRRDTLRAINIRPKIGDTIMAFHSIEADTYTESDRGYGGEWGTSTWASLTMTFKPEGA